MSCIWFCSVPCSRDPKDTLEARRRATIKDTVEARRMQVCDRHTAHAIIAISPFMQMVEQEYEELFPREVEAVHVCYDLADLNGFVKEYEKLKKNLEDLVDDYTSKKRRHKSIKRKKVTSLPPHAPCPLGG